MTLPVQNAWKLFQFVRVTRKLTPISLKVQAISNVNPLTSIHYSTETCSGANAKHDKYGEAYRKRMANYYSMFIGSLVGIVGSSYFIYKRLTEGKAEGSVEGANKEEDADDVVHKSKAGFKERKIIEYENRIRAYSTPDKIFRYFATLQDYQTGEIYMTPEDFVRALTPDTMQPSGLGLDQFKKFDRKNPPRNSTIFGADSVFHCFGDGALITFSDYMLLVTALGTSSRHIKIAFKLFDFNGDGEVTLEEFKKVLSLFLNMTTTGSRHRDRKTTGNVLQDDVNSGLATYFFGKDGSGKLTSDQFVQFKRRLQKEVMFLEFTSFNPKDGKITIRQFAEMLLLYANFPPAKRHKVMKRINALYGDEENEPAGITFQDYLDFFSFLLNILDVEMALSFHTVSGQAIDKATLKRVAKTVAGVQLQDHIVNIVFSIFDENGDNQLSNKEFISVMRDKMLRGLNKPKDTGFTRFVSALYTCAVTTIKDSWGAPNHSH